MSSVAAKLEILGEESEMGRSVSAAAAQAVEKSNKKAAVERTIADIIVQARNNAASGLSVTSADILAIISTLDSFRTQLVQATNQLQSGAETIDFLGKENEELKAQVAEFRRVYEQENRSSSVKVEQVDEFQNVKVEATVDTNAGAADAPDVLQAGVAGVLNASTSGE